MNVNGRLTGRDWLTTAGFFAVTFATRVPFRTHYAYLWDSVEFTLAIRHYNVVLSQPHSPGYFLYVMLARLVNGFVGDPHASLVWISVVAGSGLTAAMYLLGAALFRRSVGVMAALVTLTSPLVWFFSCVALTYVVDALLVSVVVLCCWYARQRGVTWGDVLALSALMAVVGGVRQQTFPGLAILVGATLVGIRSQRGWKLAVAVVVCVALSAAWVIPMVKMTGGWTAYRSALQRITQFHAHKTILGGGMNSLMWNVFFAALYSFDGLMLGALVLFGGLIWFEFGLSAERRRAMLKQWWTAEWVMALWLLPVVALGTLVGYTEAPGHVFTYLPCLLLLVGFAADQLPSARWRVGVALVVCAGNAFIFIAWPQSWDGILWGTVHTAQRLRQHDERLVQTVDAIRAQYDPSKTVVCLMYGDLFFGLRHLQLYLPEFDQYRLTPDLAMATPRDKPLLCVRRGQLQFVSGIDWIGKKTVLLIVPPGSRLQDFNSDFDIGAAKMTRGGSGIVYELNAEFRRRKAMVPR